MGIADHMSFAPVVVMSFNRPDLLRQVLQSIKHQSLPVVLSNVHLFQDGADSRFSPENSSDNTLQRRCVDVFREEIAAGQVHLSDKNLGIALNFDRAERFVFETLEAPYAVFLEDDLILGKNYMAALTQLADYAMAEPEIAYVAAYGDHLATLADQQKQSNKIVPLRHKWAFALTRRQWLRQKEFVDGYLDIVREREYAKRDAKAIANYFASHGYTSPGTSQDAAKDVASHVLGTAKIMSFACFGKYVGETGSHFKPADYERMGYGRTKVFDGPVPKFEMPSSEILRLWVDGERERAKFSLPASQPAQLSLRPSMTADEQSCYRSALVGKRSLVEFGSGGSTVFAAACGIKEIVSVESDASWLEKIKSSADIRAYDRKVRFDLRHIDIGPTGQWGTPKEKSAIAKWPNYWRAPWPLGGVDVVLVDGRFRVACALNALLNTSPETTIVVHDFWNRPHYHQLLEFLLPVARADSLAIFLRRPSFDPIKVSNAVINNAFDSN